MQGRNFSYEEWLELDTGNLRTELLDGKVYVFKTPDILHQSIAGEIHLQIADYLSGKACKSFLRIGVRIEENTVFAPDIAIVCDRSKLDKYVCNGVPDLVIEILSPVTIKHDKITKFKAYRKAGVKEYWIVSPDEKMIDVHNLINDMYTTDKYLAEENIPVNILSGLEINLASVFLEQEN